MANIGVVSIGVAASTAGLSKGLKSAQAQVGGFGSAVSSIGSGIGGALAFAGVSLGVGTIVAGVGKAISAGSDLNESLSKVGVIFGPSAGVVTGAAEEMASKFGIVKSEFLDAAGGLGSIGKASGLTQDKAAGLGVEFTKLAADVSSIQNVGFDEALGAIRSGLVGEAEPLRRFGVLLSEAAVKAEAAKMGIVAVGGKLTEAQKVAARANIIRTSLADASGDLERTAGGVANLTRTIGGRFTNLAADVGMALQPAAQAVLGFVGGALGGLTTWFDANKGTFAAWGQTFLDGFQAIGARLAELPAIFAGALGGDTLGLIANAGGAIKEFLLGGIELAGLAWRNLPTFVDVAVLMITEKVVNLGEWIGGLAESLGRIAMYVAGNWKQLITDGVNAVASLFQNLGTNLFNLGSAFIAFLKDPTGGFAFDWTPLLTGFEATASQLPELVKPHLTSMQSEIDAKLAEVGQAEAARAAETAKQAQETAAAAKAGAVVTPVAGAKAGAKAGEAASKAAEKPFAGAVELGSKEARTALLAASVGGEDAQREQLKTQREQLAAQYKQIRATEDLIGLMAEALVEPVEI